jgi:hypothetical protein
VLDREDIQANSSVHQRNGSQQNIGRIGDQHHTSVNAGSSKLPPVGVRWTVGNVSALGFEALRLSILGAIKIFGSAAADLVCVNSITTAAARALTGRVPDVVEWRQVDAELPDFIKRYLAPNMAEGVGWKFAPLTIFRDRYAIALDNDCILWTMPDSLRSWLADNRNDRTLIAEDVRACFESFPTYAGLAREIPGFAAFRPDSISKARSESNWKHGPERC